MPDLRWIHVSNPVADGVVCEQGAHVCDWTPAEQAPVLFLSGESRMEAGHPIRGGIPVIFPWFGPDPDGRGRPAHGFARRLPWQVLDCVETDAEVRVAFELTDDDATLALWPYRFALRLDVAFGTTLEVALRIENRGGVPFRCEAALHTYLAVSDIGEISVRGLEGTGYVDKVDGGERKLQDAAPIRFTAETDRVYHDTDATVWVDDPILDRILEIAKEGSRSTVLWTPWAEKAARLPDLDDDEWQAMLCVETANVGDDAITLAPGATHVMRATIACRA